MSRPGFVWPKPHCYHHYDGPGGACSKCGGVPGALCVCGHPGQDHGPAGCVFILNMDELAGRGILRLQPPEAEECTCQRFTLPGGGS